MSLLCCGFVWFVLGREYSVVLFYCVFCYVCYGGIGLFGRGGDFCVQVKSFVGVD